MIVPTFMRDTKESVTMLQARSRTRIVPHRRFVVGAEVIQGKGVHFRVWAPRCRDVSVVIHDTPGTDSSPSSNEHPLEVESEGWFSALVPAASAGNRYGFRLDDDPRIYPDPASRFQPDGPDGLSQVIDPHVFPWTDAEWGGVQLAGQVIYEMHIGTFTTEGTWAAASEQLAELADVGITVVEVMPIADFPGRFGWGYDGVNLFAPTRLYGTPDDFRRFVNKAHAIGIGVILDVVYNHVGPHGNFLTRFSDHYFTDRHQTDWGKSIQFDGPDALPVREFYLANAEYWIQEFHLDGLRLDATQDIHDESPHHILTEIGERVREAAGERKTILVAENEPQLTRLVRPAAEGGYGLDGLWNDDFHHAAMVALTGHNEAYYTDYHGDPQEFISAAKYGYLYQGQPYKWQKKRRGTPAFGLSPATFITFIQNHDQVANSGHGLRCHLISHPGNFRALTALMLLGPGTPMLFQGQEFGASSPFYFFADHEEELSKRVAEGRKDFMKQFPSVAIPESQARLPDPADPMTFIRSKLDFTDRLRNAATYQLHRDLLALRRTDPAFRQRKGGTLDGAVLGAHSFVLRFFVARDEGRADRLLVVNLGRDCHLSPAPEPLLAPPENHHWRTLWSSESHAYGGCGTPPLETENGWRIPGYAAIVLGAAPNDKEMGDSHDERAVKPHTVDRVGQRV